MKYLYIIEIQSKDEPLRWTPMYQPCYSLEEAKKKAKTKRFGYGVRISRWFKDTQFNEIVVDTN